ncbi:Uncharacterised protein [Enterobacter cloacae]|nr:Uncharacterised protein [Enterobacter cloacae]
MYFDMLAMMGDVTQLAKSVDGVGTDETGNIPLGAYTPDNPPPAGTTSVDNVEADETGNIPLNAYTPDNPPPLVIPLPGEPGSCVMASISVSGSSGGVYKRIGQTVSGSQIRPACLLKDTTTATDWTEVTPDFTTTSNLTGTWACAGYVPYGFGVTLWTRIDQPVSLSSGQRLQVFQQPVRNCQFSLSDHSTIDCEILNGGQWLPFTASMTDKTAHGPAIYSNALAGLYGPVKEYAGPTKI